MGYWFKCFPQLDSENHCFVSPRLEKVSACEGEEEASLTGGGVGRAGGMSDEKDVARIGAA